MDLYKCMLLSCVLWPLVFANDNYNAYSYNGYQNTNYKVIIIGAGAAGIAAATRLLENQFDDFVILEGEDRIGGRIFSQQVDNIWIDLGAEYCEGETGNIVYELVKEYNILKETDTSLELVYSNGSLVEDAVLANELLEFKDNLVYKEWPENDDILSYGEFFLQHYDQDILEKYQLDKERLKICVDAISTLESDILVKEGAFTWLKKSLKTNQDKLEGNQYLNWNGAGYKTILDVIMRAFPRPYEILGIDDKFVFQRVVSNIQYGGYNDNNLTVSCEDGTNYTAEFIIFTPSVGVLKHKHQHMFIPELPIEHQLCINALGFDAVLKIVLQFETRWWPELFKGKALIWSAEDKVNLAQDFLQGPVQNGASWLSNIRLVLPVPAAPNLLSIYMTGNFVKDIEDTSDEIIIEGVMHVLHKFLWTQGRITRPIRMWHTNWYTNPNFHGMRTFDTLGSTSFTFNCNEQLSKPLYNMNYKPVVLFAGEATSVNHYSTVHGAIESGYREAEEILTYYRRQELDRYYLY